MLPRPNLHSLLLSGALVLICAPAAGEERDAEDTAQPATEVASETRGDPVAGAGSSPASGEPVDPPHPPQTLNETLDESLDAPPSQASTHKAFELLDGRIPPGETLQVPWYASDSFTGLAEPTPVLVAHGAKPGPVLCLTAAVHGDELNGIEMVRQLLYEVDPQNMQGTLIGVPIVNLFGFRQGSRYLPDRRDLNRYFPGNADGSAASRIAHSLFENVIRRCDALVDLHTGSFHRTNLPQLRAQMDNPEVAELTKGFGATAVLNSTPPEGTLRGAGTAAGVPSVTLEAGEPMRFQKDAVDHGVRALRSVINRLGIVERFSVWGDPQPVYYESHWVRADNGGILTSRVEIGQEVDEGQLLGSVTDPITNQRAELRSPYDGRIIGMALNQAVIPGFAAYHIGVQRSDDAPEAAPPEPPPVSDTDPAPDAASQSDAGIAEPLPQQEDPEHGDAATDLAQPPPVESPERPD